ncbi:hypothetical protein Pint_21327 [Pistacia integerrima]|uniref:Uncharacterized protein n=1 Tax=Pistacia integerrima TaxID=434235 RepID=A0ACC0XC22_9ROSI|nr:hypothetical protein Pint_21327 [Pistacia integerrima]
MYDALSMEFITGWDFVYYKRYLDVWMLPLFFIGYCIPQQLSLKHPAVRVKVGLPDKDAPSALEKSEEIDSPGKHLYSPAKQRKISLKDLTPKGPVALSVKHLSKGQKERAISFLQLALDKDSDYINALIVMGQTQLQKGLLLKAIEYLEHAISKATISPSFTSGCVVVSMMRYCACCVFPGRWRSSTFTSPSPYPLNLPNTSVSSTSHQLFVSDHPTELENSDLLIVASQLAGVAYIKQVKLSDAFGILLTTLK